MTLSTAEQRSCACADEASHDAVVGGFGAWRCLDAGRGQILAVFRRSVYIEGPAGLCCIGDASLCAGPLNLTLRRSLPALALGDVWSVHDDQLSLGAAATVSLRPRQVWRAPALVQPQANSLRAAVVCATAALRAQGRVTSDAKLARGASVAAAIERQLSRGCEALARWLSTAMDDAEDEDLPGEIYRLLGCGPGLTPSGDDIVAGALVALRALGAVNATDRLCESLMTRAEEITGQISVAHLRAAAGGEAVAPVHDLLESLVAHQEQASCIEINDAIARLGGHGARSGWDAARGVLVAADAVAAHRCAVARTSGASL